MCQLAGWILLMLKLASSICGATIFRCLEAMVQPIAILYHLAGWLIASWSIGSTVKAILLHISPNIVVTRENSSCHHCPAETVIIWETKVSLLSGDNSWLENCHCTQSTFTNGWNFLFGGKLGLQPGFWACNIIELQIIHLLPASNRLVSLSVKSPSPLIGWSQAAILKCSSHVPNIHIICVNKILHWLVVLGL